jgi:peptidyl-prolyl cis-trans isomerase D
MLSFLRRNARSWLMYAILGIIIFVFVLYFGSNKAGRYAEAIAVVDGKIISEGELQDEYTKLIDIARMRFGAKLTPEVLKEMDLKKAAFDSLLNRRIIIAKAADLKVKVFDDELRKMIMLIPALQSDGAFDQRKYQQLLRYNKTSAGDFENMQRVELATSKIEALIRDGIKVSDKEVFDFYAIQNQKINVNFVQIGTANINKKIAATQDELETYLKNNGKLFLKPEQVKIKYLSFNSSDFAPAHINDSDIRDYYNRTRDKYRNKKGKQLEFADARSLIIKELKNLRGIQDAYAAAKKAHNTIYQEDNFDAYAAKNNLKINTADFFPINQFPRALASVKNLATLFADLQKNEISKVIKTDDACYVIKIIDKKSSYLPKLSEISNEVEKYYIENEKQNMAGKEASATLADLKKTNALDQVAKEKGLKVGETGMFQPGNIIPKVGVSPEAAEAIIQLNINKPYTEKPFRINNSYLIFKLKEAGSIDQDDFTAKKDMYKRALISFKRNEIMQAWLLGHKEKMTQEGRIKIKKYIKDL